MTNQSPKPEATSFDDLVRERADLFDGQDCRPGPSQLDEEYSDSLVPDFLREKTMAVRRKRRRDAAGKPAKGSAQ